MNLVSDGGRGAVARGRLGTRCGAGSEASIRAQLVGAGSVRAARSSGRSGQSNRPGRSWRQRKKRREKKRGPLRIPGSRRTRGQPGQSRSAMCKRSPALSAPHGQVPTRLTEQKESWCRTTDKSRAGPRFHLLDCLSSHQEQANPTRSRAPLQRQPRARAFDTGQGVERMVKRS